MNLNTEHFMNMRQKNLEQTCICCANTFLYLRPERRSFTKGFGKHMRPIQSRLTDWLYGLCLGTLAGCQATMVFGQLDDHTWLVTVLLMGLAVTGMVFLFLWDSGGEA